MRECVAVDAGRISYGEGLALQRRLAALRAAGEAPDLLLLCEHDPVVTIGRSGGREHVDAEIGRRGVPVVEVERGGDVTYHGPGQVVGYPILALEGAERDLHRLLRGIEETILRSVAGFGIAGERLPGLTGVWVGKRKLCAIGVAVRRWVTLHGFALNVNVDLRPFGWIVPCGLHGYGVTSMECELGAPQDTAAVRAALIHAFGQVFDRAMEPGGLPMLAARERSGAHGDDGDLRTPGGDG